MALDRSSIQRSDFPTVRRGYEPGAVDAHLREIADEAATDEPYRLEWRVDAPLDPHPIRGSVTVTMTVDFDRGVAHFVAHALFREVLA